MFRFWQRYPRRTKRIITIIAFFAISIVITIAGILTPLSEDDANALGSGFDETQTTTRNMSPIEQVSSTFGNNFMISLIGFVPIAGPMFEFYVLYSTGVVMTAYIQYKHFQVSPLLVLFGLFLFPVTWLEFIAYSTAVAESFWLTWCIIHGEDRKEIRNACIFISICAVMLLVAAIAEIAIIAALS